MLFVLLACTTDPCKDMNCLCPEGTGTLIIENVSKASIQKKTTTGEQLQVITCSPSKENVSCSFRPDGEVFQIEVLIGEKAFPIDIKSTRKNKKNCCACEYFEFSPHHPLWR